MDVLVTGGAGFIGSHLSEELAKDNEVTAIDNLSTGKLENIRRLIDNKKIVFKKGDIRDLEFLKSEFEGADYVFHQAAVVSVPKSVEKPLLTNDVNTNGTLSVLIAARDCNVKKVVFASSCAVYGDNPHLPLKEDMLPMPLSPYASSKLAGEYYCQVFTKAYGLSTSSLRYFNVYGPRQDVNSDYAAVIPKFIKRVLENKPPIIYGDGEQTRDFIFVKDVVNANILAAESSATGIFNTASGEKTSIDELASTLMSITGTNLNLIHEKPRQGDIKHSAADISKAREKLNFKPKHSLEEGLRETVKCFKK